MSDNSDEGFIVSSLRELKKPSAVIITLLLTGASILLTKFLGMYISPDLRVTFAFVGIMGVAVLYGAVPCMISAAAADIIGYIIDDGQIRSYNLWILAVKLICALFYGWFLYRKRYGRIGAARHLETLLPSSVVENIEIALRGVAARIAVIFIGNIVLNSMVLYHSYRNKAFPFVSGAEWHNFLVWARPRADTNLSMMPYECAVCLLALPVLNILYTLGLNYAERPKRWRKSSSKKTWTRRSL